MLLSVSGVGPKAALSILSASTPESLAMAVVSDNEKTLTAAPGVGKKLAQRIILELKDKIAKDMPALKQGGYVPPSDNMGMLGAKLSDVTAALTVLGYSQSEITNALRSIDIEPLSVEEVIKEVLKSSLK